MTGFACEKIDLLVMQKMEYRFYANQTRKLY